jgi:hypothetical protein
VLVINRGIGEDEVEVTDAGSRRELADAGRDGVALLGPADAPFSPAARARFSASVTP